MQDKIKDLASYCSIIHHISGRVRVRVSPKIKKYEGEASLEDIEAMPEKIKGIKKIKINKLVGSITIEYNPEIFKDSLWDDLFNGENLDEITGIINKLKKEVA